MPKPGDIYRIAVGDGPAMRYMPQPPKHGWIVMVGFDISTTEAKRWLKGTEPELFTGERVLTTTMPACWHCEMGFSLELAAEPCKGNPVAYETTPDGTVAVYADGSRSAPGEK